MSGYVVVKIGGHALATSDGFAGSLDALATGVKSLAAEGRRPVIVHGAGPQISAMLDERGVTSEFRDGLRVTNDDAMAVVAMALSYVNLVVVAGLNERGVSAFGITGVDESMLVADVRGEQWGRTGSDVTVETSVLHERLRDGVVAVVNPVAVDRDGQLVNCNADTVAGAVAAALDAEALVLLSDVDQLRSHPDDPSSALATVTRSEIADLTARGAIRNGMVPKLAAALCALDAGAHRVIIANGSRPNGLVDALRREGLYTEVTS